MTEFESAQADGVDPEGLRLHRAAEALIGKPVYTEPEYLTAMAAVQAQADGIRHEDEGEGEDPLAARLTVSSAIMNVALANREREWETEAEALSSLNEAQAEVGRYVVAGRAA